MADTDIDGAQAAVNEQARWGDTFESRAIARLVKWAWRMNDRADAARDAIVELRQRVKALEDRPPT